MAKINMTKTSVNQLFTVNNLSLKDRIENLNIIIEKGQCWHLLGANGAGKSSLLLLLAGMCEPTHGDVLYKQMRIVEQPLAELAKTRCFLHQQQHVEFDITLAQLLGFYTSYERIPKVIDKFLDINPLLHNTLSTLSGGQQQRFHIARNLAQIWPAILAGQGIILLDEPISHLDIKYQTAVMQLLAYICSTGNTVVMTCHDINISQQYASHVGLLHTHTLRFQGLKSDVLSLANLALVFDHDFMELASPQGTHKYIVSVANQSI